jgi:hypothetical protein
MKTLIRSIAFVVLAYAVLIGAGRLLQTERGTLVVVAAAFALAMAWVIRAATRTAARIPRSGRDPSDIGPLDGL